MALAPFFERVFGSVGGHVSVSRESLTALLDSTAVGVHCGPALGQNDLWIAELVTNLLARIYPRIEILAAEPHRAKLQDLASKINPNIEFIDAAPGPNTICIAGKAQEGAICPSSRGWVARVHHTKPQESGIANPYAAGAAAALACSELFRRVFLKTEPEPDVSLSLLDFGNRTGADLETSAGGIGDVLFVAVGAIGNGALWALGRDATLKGNLSVVDPEDLSLLNLQRYVLGTFVDVNRSKVSLAGDALQSTHLSTQLVQKNLEDFVNARERFDFPTVCISVDNVDARRSAQALLPRLVVNGWTGEAALGASWHVFSNEMACLACLYHPKGKGPSATEQAAKALGLSVDRATLLWVTQQPISDNDLRQAARALGVEEKELFPWRGKSLGDLYTDVVCGAVPLDVVGLGRTETVPLAHQSVLAGILMAAELLKRTSPKLSPLSQPEPLTSWDDILRPPPPVWRKPRPREPGCICGDEDYHEAYTRKWAVNS